MKNISPTYNELTGEYVVDPLYLATYSQAIEIALTQSENADSIDIFRPDTSVLVVPTNSLGGLFGIGNVGSLTIDNFMGTVSVSHDCTQAEVTPTSAGPVGLDTYILNPIGIWSASDITIKNITRGSISAEISEKSNAPECVKEPLVVAGILSYYQETVPNSFSGITIESMAQGTEISADVEGRQTNVAGGIYGIAALGDNNRVNITDMKGHIDVELSDMTLTDYWEPAELAGIKATERVNTVLEREGEIDVEVSDILISYDTQASTLADVQSWSVANAYGIMVDDNQQEPQDGGEEDGAYILDKYKVMTESGMVVHIQGTIDVEYKMATGRNAEQGRATSYALTNKCSAAGYGLYSTKGMYAVVTGTISVTGFKQYKSGVGYDANIAIASCGGPGAFVQLNGAKITGDIAISDNSWLTLNSATVTGSVGAEYVEVTAGISTINGNVSSVSNYVFTGFDAASISTAGCALLTQTGDYVAESAYLYVSDDFVACLTDYCVNYGERLAMTNMGFFGVDSVGRYEMVVDPTSVTALGKDTFTEDNYFIFDTETCQFAHDDPTLVISKTGIPDEEFLAEESRSAYEGYIQIENKWYEVLHQFTDGEAYFIRETGDSGTMFYGAIYNVKPQPQTAAPTFAGLVQAADGTCTITYEDADTPADQLVIYYRFEGENEFSVYNPQSPLIPGENTYFIESYAVDPEGNTSETTKSKVTPVGPDTLAPEITNFRQTQTALLFDVSDNKDAADAITISYQTRDSWTGALSEAIDLVNANAITIDSSMSNVIIFAKDSSGNTSSASVDLDWIGPDYFIDESHVYDENPYVVLTYVDNIPDAAITVYAQMLKDDVWSEWQPVANPYQIFTQATDVASYNFYAVDAAGNQSNAYLSWKIDCTAPVLMGTVTAGGENTFELTYMDDMSKQENLKIYYAVKNNGVWGEEQEYTGAIQLKDGDTEIKSYAVDVAGNVSRWETTTVNGERIENWYQGCQIAEDTDKTVAWVYYDDVLITPTTGEYATVFWAYDGNPTISGADIEWDEYNPQLGIDLSGVVTTTSPFLHTFAGVKNDDGSITAKTAITDIAIDSKLISTAEQPSDYAGSTAMTWDSYGGQSATEDTIAYEVTVSSSTYGTVNYTTDATGVDIFAPQVVGWSVTVSQVEDDTYQSTDTTILKQETRPSASQEQASSINEAADNGNDHIFIASATEKWGKGFVAKHDGALVGDTVVGKVKNTQAFLYNSNRYCDFFNGAVSGANVIFLSDSKDGLFIDDIYSTTPAGTEAETTARIKNVTEIYAGAGNDILDMTSARFAYLGNGITFHGGNGNDTIWSNAGNNRLFGDDGNDSLIGNVGNDWLVGGAGDDTMNGNGGDDIFVFGEDFGNDIVRQTADGTVTLWFKQGSLDNWNADTLTYTDGENSVCVENVKSANITLRFGCPPSDTDTYNSLVESKAFENNTSSVIYKLETIA